MSQEPLLSVCLITYNHEKYVREALDGIFMQEVDFPMEIIVADDCSTDNTRAIIMEYYEKHSDIMRLVFQEKNVGPAQNWLDLMNAPKGKYIAYLEGDDYWTDPLKLQKQVDFLEKNPDYTICFHNTLELTDGKLSTFHLNNDTNKTFIIQDLAKKNLIHTPSVVYRKVIDKIPDWLQESPAGDYPLHMLHAEKGKIYCIAENMAVYRKNAGIWSAQDDTTKLLKWLKVLNLLISHFNTNISVKKILEDSVYTHSIFLLELYVPSYQNILKNKMKEHVKNTDIKNFIKTKLNK